MQKPAGEASRPVYSEIAVHRRVELRQESHPPAIGLKPQRDLQGKDATVTQAPEKVGTRGFDSQDIAKELGGDIGNGRQQRFTGQQPLLLQRQDIKLEKRLLRLERTAEFADFRRRAANKERRTLPAPEDRNCGAPGTAIDAKPARHPRDRGLLEQQRDREAAAPARG